MKKLLIVLLSLFLFSCNKKEQVVTGNWDVKIQINVNKYYIYPATWIKCPYGYPYPMWWQYDTTLYNTDYVTLMNVIVPNINKRFYSDTTRSDTTIINLNAVPVNTINESFAYKITTSYKVISESLN